jgi:hypothetical protein
MPQFRQHRRVARGRAWWRGAGCFAPLWNFLFDNTHFCGEVCVIFLSAEQASKGPRAEGLKWISLETWHQNNFAAFEEQNLMAKKCIFKLMDTQMFEKALDGTRNIKKYTIIVEPISVQLHLN